MVHQLVDKWNFDNIQMQSMNVGGGGGAYIVVSVGRGRIWYKL